jgi:hypothetical protein
MKMSNIEIYQQLFNFYITQYNWAYQDSYPEVSLFPQSTYYALLQLHQLKPAANTMNTSEFSQHIIDSFPMVVEDFVNDHTSDPYEQATSAYALRLLQRFFTLFGLITVQQAHRFQPQLFAVNPAFNDIFCFNIKD